MLPPRRQHEVLEAWDIAIDKTGGYLYSRLLLALLNAVFTFACYGARRPFAVPLALWQGFVSQFIPVVGTYIAAAVPLLVALLGDPWDALFFLIFVLVYQQIENYLLAPRITAKTMQLHPAVAFGAALAGGAISGLIGAFMALPAAAVIQATVSTYLRARGRRDRAHPRGRGQRSRSVSRPRRPPPRKAPSVGPTASSPGSRAGSAATRAEPASGWERYVGANGEIVGMDTFGASAPLKRHCRRSSASRRGRSSVWPRNASSARRPGEPLPDAVVPGPVAAGADRTGPRDEGAPAHRSRRSSGGCAGAG